DIFRGNLRISAQRRVPQRSRIDSLRSLAMSRSDRSSERGAIIIQVAIALLGLTIFSAFVLDYGVLWTSRGQAQNAADAGALAGAQILQVDPTAATDATNAARALANQNAIWGQAPIAADVNVSSPLPSRCPDGSLSCIKVDVYRGGTDLGGTTHTNVLPTF